MVSLSKKIVHARKSMGKIKDMPKSMMQKDKKKRENNGHSDARPRENNGYQIPTSENKPILS
jgi:hypothetical protein